MLQALQLGWRVGGQGSTRGFAPPPTAIPSEDMQAKGEVSRPARLLAPTLQDGWGSLPACSPSSGLTPAPDHFQRAIRPSHSATCSSPPRASYRTQENTRILPRAREALHNVVPASLHHFSPCTILPSPFCGSHPGLPSVPLPLCTPAAGPLHMLVPLPRMPLLQIFAWPPLHRTDVRVNVPLS